MTARGRSFDSEKPEQGQMRADHVHIMLMATAACRWLIRRRCSRKPCRAVTHLPTPAPGPEPEPWLRQAATRRLRTQRRGARGRAVTRRRRRRRERVPVRHARHHGRRAPRLGLQQPCAHQLCGWRRRHCVIQRPPRRRVCGGRWWRRAHGACTAESLQCGHC